ncbi:MAG: DUF739 family protein [Clostridium perfringens]|uniref:Conserved domain protein n=1 Tax=Clostridium butyricum E4 str. BoNT E BL5262 TaxID=632245 RepID=C4ILG8_CLOBU|nr:DUF739 family protein [Clostridium butyricum]MDU5776255.1 DUF739 family protein [Clostridium perfringens]EDT77080.1 conserved domain protein [Clostridium butyricum 5521]EEP53430.1 conserved domain protein [Clostridium butyricum E4 str. BoNT E BL5262]MDU5720827.1 DUF739 family protein [Clostridium butyricum]NFL32995.1 DUF739 family protein [Clostridium butyricum]
MNVNLLKSKRVEKGFIQKTVAKSLELTEKTYNHKENGKIPFKPTEISSLSNLLGLNISEINHIFFDDSLPIGKTG